MKYHELFENEQLTIDDLITPDEKRQAIELVKQNQSIQPIADIVAQRIQSGELQISGKEAVGIILKFKNQLDRQFRPDVYKTPDMSGAWDTYADTREKHLGRGPGGLRNYAGD